MDTNGITEYRTVRASSADVLDKTINELLKEKWLLYGNPYTNNTGGHFQALVKKAAVQVGAMR